MKIDNLCKLITFFASDHPFKNISILTDIFFLIKLPRMLYRYIRITYHQTDRIASISGDLGVVFVASVMLPSLFNQFSIGAFIGGTLLSSIFMGISIYLSK